VETPKKYIITRDGEQIGATLTSADAFYFLHNYQGQSVDWAIRYAGYDVVDPDGNKWSEAR
jgi:hypothetical protein